MNYNCSEDNGKKSKKQLMSSEKKKEIKGKKHNFKCLEMFTMISFSHYPENWKLYQ